MSDKSIGFLDRILDDFHSLNLQFQYADSLPDSKSSLAEYIRLSAAILESPDDIQRLLERAHRLYEDPSLWEWDQFLSLRRIPDFEEIIQHINEIAGCPGYKNNCVREPASLQEIEYFEEHLKLKLPPGYRAFLESVANGVVAGDTCFYSIAEMFDITKADKWPQRTNELFPLTYQQVVRMHSKTPDESIGEEFWEDGYPDGQHFRLGEQGLSGLLPIGVHGYGKYYIVLQGELSGLFWGTGPDEDSYQADWMYHPQRCAIPEEAQGVPVPALTAIFDVLDNA